MRYNKHTFVLFECSYSETPIISLKKRCFSRLFATFLILRFWVPCSWRHWFLKFERKSNVKMKTFAANSWLCFSSIDSEKTEKFINPHFSLIFQFLQFIKPIKVCYKSIWTFSILTNLIFLRTSASYSSLER